MPASPVPRPDPGQPSEPRIGPAPAGRIHVMSCNIRCDRSADGSTRPGEPDHWPERRPVLVDLLRREQPTVLGVQEALHGQIPAIEEALPGHRMLGLGREGGSAGEHCAIFYDADRFEVLAWDQLWLSGTPRLIGSATWGNSIPRIVVRAHLRERSGGAELAVLTTHLDHASEPARLHGARALVELLEQEAAQRLPALVMGDFNAAARASGAYATLVTEGPCEDTWDTAERRLTPAWGTFPDYRDPVEGADRIDWILAAGGVRVHQAAITVHRDARGRQPTDHAAVQALVELP